MPKGKNPKLSPTQRQARTYQVVFAVVSLLVLFSMVLSLIR
jgi:hypothetical protein